MYLKILYLLHSFNSVTFLNQKIIIIMDIPTETILCGRTYCHTQSCPHICLLYSSTMSRCLLPQLASVCCHYLLAIGHWRFPCVCTIYLRALEGDKSHQNLFAFETVGVSSSVIRSMYSFSGDHTTKSQNLRLVTKTCNWHL